MALGVFNDKSAAPRDCDLEPVLGRSAGHWRSLKALLAAQHAPLSETWKYGGAKYGWSLQLQQKKRTVVYMIPKEKHFLAAFALGEKAVAAALEAGLPTAMLELIESAPKYPEGRGVRVPVRTKSDVAAVLQLAALKMAH